MTTVVAPGPGSEDPGFRDLFTPKLVTVLREGYRLRHLQADAIAGLTVAIVALPLSMAIAIASGATPAMGLYTAIVGGFLVSMLGGSRFQVGGPAGAFIVLVAATVQAHGIEGLIVATMLSGVIMAAVGLLRLGTYIKFIPYPVTVGFTAGIAVIIFASQIGEMLGLTFAAPEPGPLLEKLPAIWAALPTITPAAFSITVATVLLIVGIRHLRPNWPGMLIGVGVTSLLAALFGLDVATIGSRFGGIPSSLPSPTLPEFDLALVQAVIPSALSFALLGSIESLLSAVVADGMTGRRHRSNCELVAQGVANIVTGLFGGFCVTGTIARTATNVRAGAHGPIAGMLHAVFLLLFMLIAAPLAAYIPLASLAGVLAVVAWNMVERQAVVTLFRASRGDMAVLSITFLLTIFRGLTEAIIIGFAAGSVLFIHRMSRTTAVETRIPLVAEDRADRENGRDPYDERREMDPEIVVYRIRGAFFFGAAASIGAVLDRIQDMHRALIIDLAQVPFLDSTGANTIDSLARKARRKGVDLYLTGTSHEMRRELFAHGLKPPLARYAPDIPGALQRARSALAEASVSEGEDV